MESMTGRDGGGQGPGGNRPKRSRSPSPSAGQEGRSQDGDGEQSEAKRARVSSASSAPASEQAQNPAQYQYHGPHADEQWFNSPLPAYPPPLNDPGAFGVGGFENEFGYLVDLDERVGVNAPPSSATWPASPSASAFSSSPTLYGAAPYQAPQFQQGQLQPAHVPPQPAPEQQAQHVEPQQLDLAAQLLEEELGQVQHPAQPVQEAAQQPQPPESDAPPPSGAQVVQAAYGNGVRIDSVLCKRLADEPAQREPVQRRVEQRLNIERRSNVEALLAHVTGQVAPRPCKNCHKGHGPWTQCVVYDGQICGSCSNCWFNASGARCTFHENNNPQPPQQPQSQQSLPLAAPQFPPQQQASPYQQPAQPAHSAVSAASSPAPSAAHRPHLPQGSAHLVDIGQLRLPAAARQAVARGMDSARVASPRLRLIARIEAAAKELGMRLAEYDEYTRSPAGVAEDERRASVDTVAQQGHNERASRSSSPPSQHPRQNPQEDA